MHLWSNLSGWSSHLLTVVILEVLALTSVVEGFVINAGPDPTRITCWTCPNKTDNKACNDWAPDLMCPHNHTVCHTLHRFDTKTGKSLMVNKKCAREDQCTQDMIGCHESGIPGVKDCISCCNKNYCNEPVPSNHSTAILFSSLSNSGTSVRWTIHTAFVTFFWTIYTFTSLLLSEHTTERT